MRTIRMGLVGLLLCSVATVAMAQVGSLEIEVFDGPTKTSLPGAVVSPAVV